MTNLPNSIQEMLNFLNENSQGDTELGGKYVAETRIVLYARGWYLSYEEGKYKVTPLDQGNGGRTRMTVKSVTVQKGYANVVTFGTVPSSRAKEYARFASNTCGTLAEGWFSRHFDTTGESWSEGSY